MNGDRMVIRKRNTDSLMVDEHNGVHDLHACPHFKDYDGSEKPKCNCVPCWTIWQQVKATRKEN